LSISGGSKNLLTSGFGRVYLARVLALTSQKRSGCAHRPAGVPQKPLETHQMQDNRISATLSDADRQAVLAAINTIRQKLPFLIDLTPEERHALPKMGDRSRAFVSQALEVATQNPNILPVGFDTAEMRKDVELASALDPILTALMQLSELIEDTYMAVGSEAYTSALLIYQFARAAGRGSALDGALDGLARRFARKTAKTTPTPPTP
jgi:hypothetical protein